MLFGQKNPKRQTGLEENIPQTLSESFSSDFIIYIYTYISVIFPKISGKYDGFSTIPLLFVIQILDPGE